MGAFGTFLLLNEAKRDEGAAPKSAVFTFGRFNPPTKGHAKLIATVETLAKEKSADSFIFISLSHDKDKNPLSPADKLIFMKELFPGSNIIENDQIKNPFNATGYLGSFLKYTDVTMVTGSDRTESFKRSFNKTGKYFDSFEIVSAGERDPDEDSVVGMSGTKAREAAKRNDLGLFYAATGWDGDIALKLMRAVQKGMQDG